MQPTPVLQRALRRLPLTTKQGPHNYYKGNRTGAMGRHTKWGGYVLDYTKIRSYVCPDLKEFPLTPFVTKKIERTTETFGKYYPTSGALYLKKWKAAGGEPQHGQ